MKIPNYADDTVSGQTARGEKISANLRERWKDPTYRSKISAKVGAASRARWKDPEYKKRQMAAMKAARATPEWKAKASAKAKARLADPVERAKCGAHWKDARRKQEIGAKISAIRKAEWAAAKADPAKYQAMVDALQAKRNTPEAKAKYSKIRSRIMKEKWANDTAYRERRIAQLRAQLPAAWEAKDEYFRNYKSVLPKKKTPEWRLYEKLRGAIGAKAAREAMGLGT